MSGTLNPQLAAAFAAARRPSATDYTTACHVAEIKRAADAVRERVAFYASTPAYRAVLELHGFGEVQDELHRLSREGGWSQMASLVDDAMLQAFAVIGDPQTAARQLRDRYGAHVDRASFYAPYAVDADVLKEVASEL